MNKTKYLKGPCSECGGPLEFPVELVGTTTDCPHCGQQTELMIATPKQESGIPTKAIVWTVVSILVLLLGLGGALMALTRAQRKLAERQRQEVVSAAAAAQQASSNANTNTEPIAESSAAQAGFQVSGIKLEKTPGSSLVHAVGTLSNRSAQKRFGVKIELDLFDVEGQKVGTAKDYQAVIEAKSQWDFKAPVMTSKATSAKLATIQEDQ